MAIKRYHPESDRWVIRFVTSQGKKKFLRVPNMYGGPRPILLMSREEAESGNILMRACKRPHTSSRHDYSSVSVKKEDLVNAFVTLGDRFNQICEALWDEALTRDDERARLLVLQRRLLDLHF